jgi:hypothetical protein
MISAKTPRPARKCLRSEGMVDSMSETVIKMQSSRDRYQNAIKSVRPSPKWRPGASLVRSTGLRASQTWQLRTGNRLVTDFTQVILQFSRDGVILQFTRDGGEGLCHVSFGMQPPASAYFKDEQIKLCAGNRFGKRVVWIFPE